jgi:hypothetical protein
VKEADREGDVFIAIRFHVVNLMLRFFLYVYVHLPYNLFSDTLKYRFQTVYWTSNCLREQILRKIKESLKFY